VSPLSVQLPGQVALNLLEGQLGQEVAAELPQFLTNVKLGSDEAQRYITPGDPR